jgi:hypothetical protein
MTKKTAKKTAKRTPPRPSKLAAATRQEADDELDSEPLVEVQGRAIIDLARRIQELEKDSAPGPRDDDDVGLAEKFAALEALVMGRMTTTIRKTEKLAQASAASLAALTERLNAALTALTERLDDCEDLILDALKRIDQALGPAPQEATPEEGHEEEVGQ